MKENKITKLLIVILCALVLILGLVTAILLTKCSPEPNLENPQTEASTTAEETQKTTEPSKETTDRVTPSDSPFVPPEDLPPFVELPTQKDPVTGAPAGVTFPCNVPGYDLVIEKIAPYNGTYVEDGSNANVQNVAMLMVENKGDYPVEYTQICVEYGTEKLYFDISALPVGEKAVVQEKSGKPVPSDKADAATAMVVQRADMQMSESQVRVTDNGDNTLTVENLTGETIPTVRVFYKYYMEEEGIFVGGIAFTVRITRLVPGASVTVQPSHYTSQTSRVVMVLTYDSEV